MNILMIAFHSHPSAVVGSHRVNKFLKYLSREKQYKIDLITVNEKYYEFTNDVNSEVEMENVDIHRTNLSRRFLPLRDEGLIWFFPLLFKMLTLCHRNSYDVIYVTGNPFLQFTLLPFFKFFFKVPYVLDFRDPWVLSPYRSAKNAFYGLLINNIEKFVVKHADAVINVTSQASDLFIKNYSEISACKFHVIENGYDFEDFLNLEKIDLKEIYGDAVYICYAGKFSHFRSPKQFVKAIALYNKTRKYNKVNFIHIGNEEPSLKRLFKEYDASESYICTGFVPYRKCLSYISSADLALLISGGHPYEPTTKIFDYIALDKKILGITPSNDDGFLSDVLSKYSKSVLIKDDFNFINAAIETLDKLPSYSSHELRSRFSRKIQAHQLGLIFTKIIGNTKKNNGS